MLICLQCSNAFVFSQEVTFSMQADMRGKRLSSNVHISKDHNILKSACIFGANNSGKTCLIRVLRTVRDVIMGLPVGISPNLYTTDPVVAISCIFLSNGNEWEYAFKYDTKKREFVYESLVKITYDAYHNGKSTSYFCRDFATADFTCRDDKLRPTLPLLGKSAILIHLIDTATLPYLKEAKDALLHFAESLVIIDMNNIPLQKTIEMLKKHDPAQEEIVKIIKDADLDLDDIRYVDTKQVQVKALQTHPVEDPTEDVLAMKIKQNVEDSLRLTSVYKGHPVPSLFYDSTGTKKMTALAGYIVDALRKGQTLVVDELDSSLHFKLTRAIVALFNNELNTKAQLVFTAHDVSLMDCKKLFRKEQIWFVHKEKDGACVYPLSCFTAEDGVRGTSDIIEKYKRGVLGALPSPDLFDVLLHGTGS